jgi:hypothetical protein
MTAFGEILPTTKTMRLDRDRKDKHGLPLLVVNAVVRENERKMEQDMRMTRQRCSKLPATRT